MKLLISTIVVLISITAHAEQSCDQQVGTKQAQVMIDACTQISQAKQSCNTGNSCDLIVSEIRRSCDAMGQLEDSKMKELCALYQAPVKKFSDDANEAATLVSQKEVQACLADFAKKGGQLRISGINSAKQDDRTTIYTIRTWLSGGDVVLGEATFRVKKVHVEDDMSRIACVQVN